MGKNKKFVVTLMAITALLFLSCTLFFISLHYHKKIRQKDNIILALKEEHRNLAQSIQILKSKIPDQPNWEVYERYGITNPEQVLKKDLMKRKDLIPWKGIMGGQMAIYNENLIWFMAPNWCLAYVEDGHIGGYMLLEFRIQKERISWKLLEAQLID